MQEKHLDRPAEFWESVLWSEKTKLELFGPMDQRDVWQKKGKDKKVFPAAKHGGGSVLLWRCFAAAETAERDLVTGIVKSLWPF